MGITMDDVQSALAEHDEMQRMVSKKKYQHMGEQSFSDVINRVVNEFKRHAKCNTLQATLVESMLQDGRFIPGGRILSGLGNEDSVCTLSNCYFLPGEQDSIEGIYDLQKKMARVFSYGGGVGIDLTFLRPAGSKVSNAAQTSSGANSFAPTYSQTAVTIAQNGRRAALMESLDIRHPDALSFIWSKSKPEEVFGKDALSGYVPDMSGANISVKITDQFMRCVKDDLDWEFYYPDRDADREMYDNHWDGNYEKWEALGGQFKSYKTMPARDIFMQIAQAAWTSGDPGVLFFDTAKNNTPGTYIHESLIPMGTNPYVNAA